jgi:hypothetical protein
MYLAKHNKLIDEVKELKEQKEYANKDDFEQKALMMFELA